MNRFCHLLSCKPVAPDQLFIGDRFHPPESRVVLVTGLLYGGVWGAGAPETDNCTTLEHLQHSKAMHQKLWKHLLPQLKQELYYRDIQSMDIDKHLEMKHFLLWLHSQRTCESRPLDTDSAGGCLVCRWELRTNQGIESVWSRKGMGVAYHVTLQFLCHMWMWRTTGSSHAGNERTHLPRRHAG